VVVVGGGAVVVVVGGGAVVVVVGGGAVVVVVVVGGGAAVVVVVGGGAVVVVGGGDVVDDPGVVVVVGVVPPRPAPAGFPVVDVVESFPDPDPDADEEPDFPVVVVVFLVDVDWPFGSEGMNSAPTAVGRWGPPGTRAGRVVVVTPSVVEVVASRTGAVAGTLTLGGCGGPAAERPVPTSPRMKIAPKQSRRTTAATAGQCQVCWSQTTIRFRVDGDGSGGGR
jgi:hypothetical protein